MVWVEKLGESKEKAEMWDWGSQDESTHGSKIKIRLKLAHVYTRSDAYCLNGDPERKDRGWDSPKGVNGEIKRLGCEFLETSPSSSFSEPWEALAQWREQGFRLRPGLDIVLPFLSLCLWDPPQRFNLPTFGASIYSIEAALWTVPESMLWVPSPLPPRSVQSPVSLAFCQPSSLSPSLNSRVCIHHSLTLSRSLSQSFILWQGHQQFPISLDSNFNFFYLPPLFYGSQMQLLF